MLAGFTAFLDANVFYPAPLRDLMMELAHRDLFHAKWTDRIHDEWVRALREKRPDLSLERLERTRGLINGACRDALVEGYEDLVESLDLPDPDDRHVLAAAIKGRADVIVTQNLKDFPRDKLAQWEIEARHPDDFLVDQFHLSEASFLEAVRTVRCRLRNPPKSVDDYLTVLRAQGLLATVAEIEPFRAFL